MISNRTKITLGILLFIYGVGRTWANTIDEQVATFTQLQGPVTVFTHPSKTLAKNSSTKGALAKFEGEYYHVRPAKVGDTLENGNIVRTTPTAKAHLVFPNGDQVNVGPATSYRVFWDKAAKPGAGHNPEWNLKYGRIRGVIEKGGARSKLMIKTRAAVMGVRGTDFYINDEGTGGTTEVSVIRGAVELKSRATQGPPAVVTAGYSGEALDPSSPAKKSTDRKTAAEKVILRKTTQEELSEIRSDSKITAKPAEAPPAEIQERVKELETRATSVVLKDIQTHDHALYAKIEKSGEQGANQLNQMALENIQKDAPSRPFKRKPRLNEIPDSGGDDDVYKDYFKPETE